MFFKKVRLEIVLLVYLLLSFSPLSAHDIDISLERSMFLYDSYFKNGIIEKEEVIHAIQSLEATFDLNSDTYQNDTYILYFNYGKLLSAYYVTEKNTILPFMQYLEEQAEKIINATEFDPLLLLAYADYLQSSLQWGEKSILTILRLPIMYRRVLLHVRGNEPLKTEVLAKLALQTILFSSEETPTKNTFIEKNIQHIETFSSADRFVAYISLSAFYMKKYSVDEGWHYLRMAQEIYPNNPQIAIIANNYSKGVFSWSEYILKR